MRLLDWQQIRWRLILRLRILIQLYPRLPISTRPLKGVAGVVVATIWVAVPRHRFTARRIAENEFLIKEMNIEVKTPCLSASSS